MVRSQSWLLPRALSRSMVLLQLRSMSMSVAQGTTTGQSDVCGLGYTGDHVDVWGPCCLDSKADKAD